MFDDTDVISKYTREDAIEDGLLIEVFKAGEVPVVATKAICEEFGTGELIEIWHEFVPWWKNVRPTLPEAEQMFVTEKHGRKVWVLPDFQAWTILFPEDY
jgi:hypothetical protein